MKRTLNKLIREERGQALIIAVILLLVGALIITPLLGFIGTGLIVGQVFEEKMGGLYAADAGVENACWKLKNGDFPACNLTDVNGMDVTVEQIGYEETEGAKLYTLQSTAKLGGETKAEIVAQVMVTGGSIEEGGEGGEFDHNPDMVALSVIDDYTIIFATQQKAEFWGREDNLDEPGTEIETEDLGLLNMATGKAHLYLDGDDVMTDPKYKINGVHYYQEGGSDYLLMSVHDNDKVGTDTFSKSDIIRLEVEVAVNDDDPDNPYPYISDVNGITLFDTIDGDVNIVALSRRVVDDTEIILFSFADLEATLGDKQFDRAEVIELNRSTREYTSLFDADDILPDNPNLVLDCLAILSESDPRLLLSFDVDPVTGSDDEPIKSQDIAIWDPGDPNDPNDDTINLHISMCEETTVTGAGAAVSILTWEVSP